MKRKDNLLKNNYTLELGINKPPYTAEDLYNNAAMKNILQTSYTENEQEILFYLLSPSALRNSHLIPDDYRYSYHTEYGIHVINKSNIDNMAKSFFVNTEEIIQLLNCHWLSTSEAFKFVVGLYDIKEDIKAHPESDSILIHSLFNGNPEFLTYLILDYKIPYTEAIGKAIADREDMKDLFRLQLQQKLEQCLDTNSPGKKSKI